MNMLTIITYQALTASQHDDLFLFLAGTQYENSSAAINMWDIDWENKSNTLPYILMKTKRFEDDNGQFHIMFDDDKIVACGGIYKSGFDSKFALAGVRTWVHKDHRTKLLVRPLLAIQRKWAIDQTCGAVGLSFDDYNKNLITVFKRTRLGENANRIRDRESSHLFYNGMNEIPFPVNIQNTAQWVIYEPIDPNWSFDWITIQWVQ